MKYHRNVFNLAANGRVLILFGSYFQRCHHPRVKLVKGMNSANGISPNKINTLLAAGFYCRRRVTINIGIVFIPYVAFFESCRARKLV